MKFRILESVFDCFKSSAFTYFIYLNPTSQELQSKEDSKGNRGVIDPEGNLYMEAMLIGDYGSNSNIIHSTLIEHLQEKKKFLEFGNPEKWYWADNGDCFEFGVCVQRYKDSADFYLAESYDNQIIVEYPKEINKIFKKAKKKNPYLNFDNVKICNIRS